MAALDVRQVQVQETSLRFVPASCLVSASLAGLPYKGEEDKGQCCWVEGGKEGREVMSFIFLLN